MAAGRRNLGAMTSTYSPGGPPSLQAGPAEPPEPPEPRGLDHGLAMFGYLCLFFTVLFAGFPAFIAVILAYVRRRDADPVTRTHLGFQIRIFWWSFWLTVIGAVLVIAALTFGAAQAVRGLGDLTLPALPAPAGAGRTDGTTALWLGAAGLGAWGWAALWTWLAPVWGALKLAVQAPIGRLPSPGLA